MLVARVVGDEVHIVDRMRTRVGLAEGLDVHKQLTGAVRSRAIDALGIFGQRLSHMPKISVRAVGTNTLRQAKNSREFLDEAEAVLGHTIEVISGREEARLVYLGVAHSVDDDGRRRLVVDIGGGSTEVIIGEVFEVLEADSLYMGCITFNRFFPGGKVTKASMEEAIVAASLELIPIERRYENLGWSQVVGSSGTITSVESILRANGWGQNGITEKGLRRLRKALVAAGHVQQIDLAGMPADRAPVLPAGVAILSALFSRLSIDRMHASQGALREGLVYDLLGRIRHEDVRDQTIRAYSERYHVDQDQARAVAVTAKHLLEQVATGWDLAMPDAARLLDWAARLHEVGKAISYSGYHKHGGYIVAHSDMPGFSRSDQAILAALVAGHRGRIRSWRFSDLPVERAERAVRLSVILRISVLLNRSRTRRAVPMLRLRARKKTMQLGFPASWLDENPLTRTDLENEARQLDKIGYGLSIE
jgi:exopolyphosphatase/guanosine-5'-triphosphate,3'-diphosphate pyrophosphatase